MTDVNIREQRTAAPRPAHRGTARSGSPSRRAPRQARDYHDSKRQTASQRAAKRRHGRKTIDRGITLDLCGVRINRDDVIDTNHFQKIGDHPRHDRFPPTMPPVRAPVAETWHNRNAACRTGGGRDQPERTVRSGDRWSVARSAASGRPLYDAHTPVSARRLLHPETVRRRSYRPESLARAQLVGPMLDCPTAKYCELVVHARLGQIGVRTRLMPSFHLGRVVRIRDWEISSRTDPDHLDRRQHPRN
jgi:hypothetical protein